MSANGTIRGAMRRLALPLVLTAVLAAPAAAQLPSASAPALGMGDNYTAIARGYNAIAWNPAMLGLPGGPNSSFTIFSVRGIAGLDPVSAADLKSFEGTSVPASVRQEWLSRITAEGSESGSAGTEITLMAASALRFGLQISTQLHGTADMGPGGAQLLLFGNAGRTGEAESLTLDGSSFDVAAGPSSDATRGGAASISATPSVEVTGTSTWGVTSGWAASS